MVSVTVKNVLCVSGPRKHNKKQRKICIITENGYIGRCLKVPKKLDRHQKGTNEMGYCRCKDKGACDSCVQRKKSDEITRNHITGKSCKGKDKNHCSKCCLIRYYGRLLRHYGNCCSSKKCPICRGEYHPKKNKIILALYYMMLVDSRAYGAPYGWGRKTIL